MNMLRMRHLLKDVDMTQMTQKEAGKLIGVPQSEISRYCRFYKIKWDHKRRNQTGENNHNYINGMGRSTIERLTRSVVVKSGRDLFTCERCGNYRDDKEQARHHKDRDRSNNDSINLEVLCDKCHRLEHEPEMIRNSGGRYVATE